MDEKSKNYVKLIVLAFLFLWVGILFARRIDLSTADLGRHLKNGEWIVNSGFNFSERHSPLYENFYSYTHPEFPVVNHHWGSGVIFFLIWKLTGYFGLSIFFVFLSLATLLIFFLIAVEEAGFSTAVLASFLLAPLIAERVEIRPEVFSVFFPAIFFYILWKYSHEELDWRWLFALPASMAFWVNLHVYFFVGILIIGVFWLESMLKKDFLKVKKIGGIFLFTIFTACLNPVGYKGLIYPFFIFKNYEYTIVENKSVWFVENYGIVNPNFVIIKAVVALLVLSFVLLFFVNRRKISLSLFILSVFFGALGLFAIRNFSLLGFFSLPIISYNFGMIFRQKKGELNHAKENGIAVMYIILAIVAIYGNFQYIFAHGKDIGVGLRSGVEEAASFVRREKIAGPFFNNYDNGGYLAWEFFPQEKVFVDNRPAEYPGEFFTDVYKPMQEKKEVWQEQENKWNFNAIIFYWRDITPWAQAFLKNISENPEWVPVYKDEYAIIFLKDNERNSELIDKFELSTTVY